VRSDEIIRLQPFMAGRPDLEDLRLVTVWLEDKQQELELLTNNFQLAAATIAAIYKERWQIELFFKLLKQQLKIKTFVGTSANAVRIQIWTALIAVLVVRYLQFRSHYRWDLSNLVALLRWNLFSYRNLWEWLNRPFDTPPLAPDQLRLDWDDQPVLDNEKCNPNSPTKLGLLPSMKRYFGLLSLKHQPLQYQNGFVIFLLHTNEPHYEVKLTCHRLECFPRRRSVSEAHCKDGFLDLLQ
jgi:hypothetical protein